ncbi:hypothetical protein AQUCO_00200761v1 [Aquilegia coerulea]|uniref:Uncharacterized protein n=1 Tax=Aquilegia coerulea TaxID=218851 RepID=A0A2G5F4M1_AQUCA|nr:hypothetical protein AQUCO_00200761v1 [Aquilegia coerulea]
MVIYPKKNIQIKSTFIVFILNSVEALSQHKKRCLSKILRSPLILITASLLNTLLNSHFLRECSCYDIYLHYIYYRSIIPSRLKTN